MSNHLLALVNIVENLITKKKMLQKIQLAKELQDDETEDTGQTIHLPGILSEHVDIRPSVPTNDNPFGDQNYYCSSMDQ